MTAFVSLWLGMVVVLVSVLVVTGFLVNAMIGYAPWGDMTEFSGWSRIVQGILGVAGWAALIAAACCVVGAYR